MTVYVDDMHGDSLGQFGRMKMSHMIADDDFELHQMADRIGVNRKWFQHPGQPDRHYDIAKSKRALAIELGAVPITMRQCAAMVARRKITGDLGRPDDAIAWRRDLSTRRQMLASTQENHVGTKNNPGKYDCLASASPNEPFFVLLGRDRMAPSLVEMWAQAREATGEVADKVGEARDVVAAMKNELFLRHKVPTDVLDLVPLATLTAALERRGYTCGPVMSTAAVEADAQGAETEA